MKGFKLNISRLFLQHIHHKLQVIGIGNVSGHHLWKHVRHK